MNAGRSVASSSMRMSSPWIPLTISLEDVSAFKQFTISIIE